MAAVPTMKVVNPNDPDGGYMVINVSRFDPAIHTKWTEPAPIAYANDTAAPAAPAVEPSGGAPSTEPDPEPSAEEPEEKPRRKGKGKGKR